MGVFIFLVIVVVVIVIAVKKAKKGNKIEDLKNSAQYALALKIKEELEKKGLTFYEGKADTTAYGEGVTGCLYGSCKPVDLKIYYASDLDGLIAFRNIFLNVVRNVHGSFYGDGFDNHNIPIMVTAELDSGIINSEDLPEYLRIAAEIIRNGGYGQSERIKG
jgi:hypothetical protein